MKKLLWLMSAILVSSSAATSIEGFGVDVSSQKNDSTEDGLINKDKAELSQEINNWNKDDKKIWLGSINPMLFDIQKNGEVKQNGHLQLDYGKTISGLPDFRAERVKSFSISSVMADDLRDYTRYFALRTTSTDTNSGINNYMLSLKSNYMEMDLANTTLTFKVKVVYEVGLIIHKEASHEYFLNAKLTNQHSNVAEKEELKSKVGDYYYDLGTLDTDKTSSDVKVLSDEVTKRINDEFDYLNGDWKFKSKLSLSEESVVIQVNESNKEYQGSLVIKYQLAEPESLLPKGNIINLGNLDGLNKYQTLKQSNLASYNAYANKLRAYYQENMPKAYARGDFDYLSVDSITMKPDTTKKHMSLITKNPEINGDFEVDFNIEYANIEDYIKSDLGNINEVNTLASKEAIEKAVLNKIETTNVDFKNMFSVSVGDTSDQMTGQITVLNLNDPSKQIFQSGKTMEINFTLNKKELSDVIKINKIPSEHLNSNFLTDETVIGEKITNYINNYYPILNNKVEISKESLGEIKSNDPNTWKVDIQVKDSAKNVLSGTKTIKFELNPVSITDYVKDLNLKLDNKFLVSSVDDVKNNIIKQIENESPQIAGLIQIKDESFNFNASDPSTWNFVVEAKNDLKSYLIGESQVEKFELSSVSLEDIFGNEDIQIAKSLLSNTLESNENILTEMSNMIFEENKDSKIYHPELKGIVDIKLNANDENNFVDKSVSLSVKEDYQYSNYISGTVNIDFSVSQIDINTLITTSGLNHILNQMNLIVDNPEKIKKFIEEYVVEITGKKLSTNQFKVEVSYSENNEDLIAGIAITDAKAIYAGSISSSVKVDKTDIKDLISAEEVNEVRTDYYDYNSKDIKNNLVSEIKQSIVNKHTSDLKPLSDDDIVITSIEKTNDPLVLDITIAANPSSFVVRGKEIIEYKLDSTSLDKEGLISDDFAKAIEVSIEDYKNKNFVISESKKLLEAGDSFLADKLNIDYDQENKTLIFTAKAGYEKLLTGQKVVSITYNQTDIRSFFGDINNDAISLDKLMNNGEEISAASSDEEIKTAAENYLRTNINNTRPDLDKDTIELIVSNISYKIQPWSYTADKAMGSIIISANSKIENDLYGSFALKFNSSRIDINGLIKEEQVELNASWWEFVTGEESTTNLMKKYIENKYSNLINVGKYEVDDSSTSQLDEEGKIIITVNDPQDSIYFGTKIIKFKSKKATIMELYSEPDIAEEYLNLDNFLDPKSEYTSMINLQKLIRTGHSNPIMQGLMDPTELQQVNLSDFKINSDKKTGTVIVTASKTSKFFEGSYELHWGIK